MSHGARINPARRRAAAGAAPAAAGGFALALLAAALIAGCGSAASNVPSRRELTLERAQFARITHELVPVARAVGQEVSASRRAWPLIADGLPPSPSPSLRAAIARASATATAIREPRFMTNAAKLTGPAAGIAGLYESYERLAERGWRLTAATTAAIVASSDSPPAVAFARNNSSLYINAIYNGHFDLSLLGKSLTSGYERLGGARAFGASLTPEEVGALAAAYSIAAVRLQPHPAGAAADDEAAAADAADE